MSESEKKAKIQWQCRRGMLELDIILQSFFDNYFEKMTVDELIAFEQFLQRSDPELFSWLMEHEKPKEKELTNLVELIKIHHKT